MIETRENEITRYMYALRSLSS